MSNITKQGIESVLAHKLHEVLTKWCVTDVPGSDPTRANHVVLGKPTSERRDEIVISIHMQHPLGPNADKDELVSGRPRTTADRPNYFPAETFGGTEVRRILGAVQINIRQKLPYSEAVDIIASVIERVRAAINREKSLVPLADDWGNSLFKLETFQAYGHASGGGNVAINTRWIDWRAYIGSTNCRDLGG
ncbi:MAG: hypothetical protein GY832_11160 [Chloroflexi bacterium]|nr:hypothetical protein [Chloroflexota bacterium]